MTNYLSPLNFGLNPGLNGNVPFPREPLFGLINLDPFNKILVNKVFPNCYVCVWIYI